MTLRETQALRQVRSDPPLARRSERAGMQNCRWFSFCHKFFVWFRKFKSARSC